MMTWYISVCVGGQSIVERSFNDDMVYQCVCVGGQSIMERSFNDDMVYQCVCGWSKHRGEKFQ